MPDITLTSLKQLWSKEKDFYCTAEVGSGVQKFVYKIFECSELFNLKEGKGSTKEIKRKNEFLEEVRQKGRKADVVIFIDSDIIIPVEVERHGNIKAGVKQLFQYQADWIKKYGILTDGYEWRFYNNTIIEETFYIDEILDNPKNFFIFWKEYITSDYYYRSFFEKKGQVKSIEHIPNLDEVREDFFKDITNLIENFENKLNLKGYFKDVQDETERKKKAVEITYAYLIQFILYKVLVDNAFPNFENDWKERLKSIDNAIKHGSYAEVLTKIKGISDKISDKIYKRLNDEQLMINDRLEEILKQPKNNINDVSVWLDILLFINRYDFANVQNEIFGYVYENYLKHLYLDEKKGQYFTDPHIVEFMLNEIGYTKENLKKRYSKDTDSISIIDPSCGSGTFLYNATHRIIETFFDNTLRSSKETEQIINDNIFGLDIAEFPLYLAEMNILMQMLPIIINEKYNNPYDEKLKVFKTHDSIAEFLDTDIAIGNTITDITTKWKKNKGQMSLFTELLDSGQDSFHRDKRDLQPMKESVENRNGISRYRFDFVIGNPPYVSYNECSQQKILFFELMKKNLAKLNNVYGFNLHSIPNNRKKYSPKPNLFSFFIALGFALLKDDGKICYIIPQTVLVNNDLDVIRYHLANFYSIEKIITFNTKLFIGRGIKQNKPIVTSSLIFICNKKQFDYNNEVEIINYKSEHDSYQEIISNIHKNKNIDRKRISQKKLIKNYANWNFLLKEKKFIDFYEEYKKNSESLEKYFNHSIAKQVFKSKFIFDGSVNIPKKSIIVELPSNEKENDYYKIPVLKSSGYSIKTKGYYPKNVKIKIAEGSQGLGIAEPCYKILWRYINFDGFYFIEGKNILPIYQQYCIASDNKEEIFFLFGILISSVISQLSYTLFKVENEDKLTFLLGLTSIKEFIRTPEITEENNSIKTEIITQTEQMLEMEKQTFGDLVDFKNVLMQKFDKAEVEGNNLIFHYKDNSAKCKILSHPKLVEDNIYNIGQGEICLTELKNTTVFDKQLQQQIKNYIDDLVFSLYFKIKLPVIGFSNREEVCNACSKHKYYQLINIK